MKEFLIQHLNWLAPLSVVVLFAPSFRLFARVQKLETRIENISSAMATREDILKLELDIKEIRLETQRQVSDIALKLEAIAGEIKTANAINKRLEHQLSLMLENQFNKIP